MDNDYLTPGFINKQAVKTGGGRGTWIYNDYLTPVSINKQVFKREEGWGATDNDYLAPCVG